MRVRGSSWSAAAQGAANHPSEDRRSYGDEDSGRSVRRDPRGRRRKRISLGHRGRRPERSEGCHPPPRQDPMAAGAIKGSGLARAGAEARLIRTPRRVRRAQAGRDERGLFPSHTGATALINPRRRTSSRQGQTPLETGRSPRCAAAHGKLMSAATSRAAVPHGPGASCAVP